jgi:hypothetical protein
MADEKTFSMGEVTTLVNELVGALRAEMAQDGGVLIKTSTTKKGEVNVEVRGHIRPGGTLADASKEAKDVFDDLCKTYKIDIGDAGKADSEYVPSFAQDK